MNKPDKFSVFDLSLSSKQDKDKAALEFLQATKECGFIYIRTNDEDKRIIDNLRSEQNKFFDLSTSEKSKINIDQNNRGYLGPGQAMMKGAQRTDQKEVFFWGREAAADDADYLAGVPLCGPNQWPENLSNFRHAVEQYSQMIEYKGQLLLGIIAIAFGQDENYFESYYGQTMLRGQLLRYPTTDDDPDQFGVAPHSDFGCLTLLYQETAGLEVQFPDGEWVAAPPIENTLIINIGDLLERWSNNRLPSTKHRVRNVSKNARYSVAMFYDPDPLAIVDPSHLLPDEPAKFESIGAAEYILSRNKKSFAHYKND